MKCSPGLLEVSCDITFAFGGLLYRSLESATSYLESRETFISLLRFDQLRLGVYGSYSAGLST